MLLGGGDPARQAYRPQAKQANWAKTRMDKRFPAGYSWANGGKKGGSSAGSLIAPNPSKSSIDAHRG